MIPAARRLVRISAGSSRRRDEPSTNIAVSAMRACVRGPTDGKGVKTPAQRTITCHRSCRVFMWDRPCCNDFPSQHKALHECTRGGVEGGRWAREEVRGYVVRGRSLYWTCRVIFGDGGAPRLADDPGLQQPTEHRRYGEWVGILSYCRCCNGGCCYQVACSPWFRTISVNITMATHCSVSGDRSCSTGSGFHIWRRDSPRHIELREAVRKGERAIKMFGNQIRLVLSPKMRFSVGIAVGNGMRELF